VEQRDPATIAAGGFVWVKKGWIPTDANGGDTVLSVAGIARESDGNGMDLSVS